MYGFAQDYFAADIDISKCLHVMSSNTLFCTHYAGKEIYHKFSHSDVSYRFNGNYVNAVQECNLV